MSSPPSSKNRALCVLLDSNFLLVPMLFRVDIFEEIPKIVESPVKFIILKPVYEEVERLARESRPKVRREMSSALELCKGRCQIMEFEPLKRETTDEVLVRAADELRCPVATNDSALKSKLRERGIPVIYLRQRSLLKVEGWISDLN